MHAGLRALYFSLKQSLHFEKHIFSKFKMPLYNFQWMREVQEDLSNLHDKVHLKYLYPSKLVACIKLRMVHKHKI
jgi:AAA+ ATPase superfamily predicted ATPase